MTIRTKQDAILADMGVQEAHAALLSRFNSETIADYPGSGDQEAQARAAARFAALRQHLGFNQQTRTFLRDVADWYSAYEARPDLSGPLPKPAPWMDYVVMDPRGQAPPIPTGAVIGDQQTYYEPLLFSAYANGQYDASPAGAKAQHQGRTVVKMMIPSPFGMRQFWQAEPLP